MAKQRHTGLVIFGACSLIAARMAFFEPKPPETASSEPPSEASEKDSITFTLIRDARYYVYGIGVIGLLMVVEDFFNGEHRNKEESGAPKREDKDKSTGP